MKLLLTFALALSVLAVEAKGDCPALKCRENRDLAIYVNRKSNGNGYVMTHVYKGKVTQRTNVDSCEQTKRGLQVWAGDVRLADLKEVSRERNGYKVTITYKGWYDFDGETDPSDIVTCTSALFVKR